MPATPKHDPVRRNARVGPVMLPAEGRKGDPPKWPLPGRMDAAEREAWAQLWATPQAVAWERLGWTRTVARYCRMMVQAEKRDASAALLGQVTILEDRLGLTPKSMRILLWQIATDEVGQKREQSEGARGRIKAVG
ncbi:hypothetical protein ACFP2T_16425 [Plantactinospora solaniradicis]|uniref:Terminase small subunit n=1 Tax=Plantactinospora solaniradicis TaxID=1723736 RepID=A0ABW1K9U9_9ACTN